MCGASGWEERERNGHLECLRGKDKATAGKMRREMAYTLLD